MKIRLLVLYIYHKKTQTDRQTGRT